MCLGAARRFAPLLRRHGFEPAPLQNSWMRERLGLPVDSEPAEMIVLTSGGAVFGGADGILQIARRIWWPGRCLRWPKCRE